MCIYDYDAWPKASGYQVKEIYFERNYKLYQNDWYWDMIEFSDFFSICYEPI